MLKWTLVACTILSITGTAMATDPVPTTAPIVQTAPAEESSTKLICKADKETGSRLKRTKVCKTRQEWEETRERSRSQIDSYEKQGAPPPLPSGGG